MITTRPVHCAFLLSVAAAVSFISPAWSREALALRSSYSLSPPPNYPFTLDESDAIQLTDGELTQGHFWTQKSTVGWMSAGTIRVSVRLIAESSVAKICVRSARGNSAGVEYPRHIDAFLVTAANTVTYGGDLMQSSSANRHGVYAVEQFCHQVSDLPATSVVIMVEPAGRYTFMDEISIYGTSSKVPTQSISGRGDSSVIEMYEQIVAARHAQHEISFYRERLKGEIGRYLGALPVTESLLEDVSSARSVGEFRAVALAAIHAKEEEGVHLDFTDPWAAWTPVDLPASKAGRCEKTLLVPVGGSGALALNATNATNSALEVKVRRDPRAEGSDLKVSMSNVVMVQGVDGRIVADALAPVEGDQVTIEASRAAQLWLEIEVPHATVGNVSRTFVVEAGGKVATFECMLHVEVVHLPASSRSDVAVNVWGYINAPLLQCCQDAAVTDLASHHVNVFAFHPSELVAPRDGALGRARFQKMLARRVKALQEETNGNFRLLFYLGLNDSRQLARLGPEIARADWIDNANKWLREIVESARRSGVADNQILIYPVDEPDSRQEFEVLRLFLELSKKQFPGVITFTTLGDLSAVEIAQLGDSVDVIQVLVKEMRNLKILGLKAINREVWSYSAEGGGKVADPTAFYRSQYWTAFSEELTGVGFWSYSDAGPTGNAWNDGDDRRPDFAVVYSGNGRLFSSKRWEAWRSGYVDWLILSALCGEVREDNEACKPAQRLMHSMPDSPATGQELDEATQSILRAYKAANPGL